MPTFTYVDAVPKELDAVYRMAGGAADVVAFDFVEDRSLGRGANVFNGTVAASGLTDTHSSDKTMLDKDANWVVKGTNIIMLEKNVGYGHQPTRTNYIRNNSNAGAVVGLIGAGGALPTNWATSSSAGWSFSVMGFGTEKGLPYIDIRIHTTGASGAFAGIYFEGNNFAATIGNLVNWSAWARVVAGNNPFPFSRFEFREIDLANTTTYNTIRQDVTVDSTYRRQSLATTVVNASTQAVRPILFFDGLIPAGQPVDFTVRIAGVQAEFGIYPGAFIPTTGAQVTRNGNKVLWNSLANYTAGFTAMYKVNLLTPGVNYARLFELTDGTGGNRAGLLHSGNNLNFEVFSGGVSQMGSNMWAGSGTGIQTFVVSCGPGYFKGQRIGGGLVSSAGPTTWPTGAGMKTIGFSNPGQTGANADDGAFASYGQKALIRPGANDTIFNEVLAIAQRESMTEPVNLAGSVL